MEDKIRAIRLSTYLCMIKIMVEAELMHAKESNSVDLMAVEDIVHMAERMKMALTCK